MFENEGTEFESTSGVESEVSSEPQVEAQPEQQAAAPQEVKEVPFHEHPRWKEVMEERNAERQARANLEAQLQQMQRQIQEASRPKSTQPDFNEIRAKMAKRFEGIDPETQAYFSQLEQQALSAKDELRQFREEQFVNKAVGRFDELNKTNGVTPEVARLYRAELDAAYREGKIRTVADLERAYTSIHEPFNKMIAEREKAALAKYTAEKKAAATRPSAQPKGKPAAPGQAQAGQPTTRAQLIAEAVTQLRASRNTLG